MILAMYMANEQIWEMKEFRFCFEKNAKCFAKTNFNQGTKVLIF